MGGSLSKLGTEWWNSSDTAPGRLWSETTVISDLCFAAHQKTGNYMGMASVSRDVMAIVDALPDEDKKLRFWGLSAGTVLGATIAAMFPGRMDRVILDGVVNSHDYYGSPM